MDKQTIADSELILRHLKDSGQFSVDEWLSDAQKAQCIAVTRLVEDHLYWLLDSPIDSYMGWSNGRREGDTLVIEVTDFNGLTWLDRAGNHHSDALKVYTLRGDNHIDYAATIEDPNTFSRPWRISMPLCRRVEDHAQLLEYKCVDVSGRPRAQALRG